MSWKSFVTAGLLCALAAPAFAAPTLTANALNGAQASGHLNADGNWVWTIRLNQSNPIVDIDDGGPITPGSPLAAELGFTASGVGGSADKVVSFAANATDFDDPNPGNVIFGWETLTNLGGTGACDSATPGNCPVGVQNGAAGDDLNEIFAALGSVDYGTDADGKDFITIVTEGPRTTAAGTLATTVLTLGGSYGSNQGRIAELNDAYDGDGTPPISLNYDTYGGVATRQAQAGDTNLDGDVTGGDFGALQTNFTVNDGQRKWFHGDFNGDGDVTGGDFGFLQTNFTAAAYTVFVDSVLDDAPGAGGGAGVPEPASMALVALAALAVGGMRFRR